MAAREDPLVPFKALTAAITMAEDGGWAGLAFGFAAFLGDLAAASGILRSKSGDVDGRSANAILTVASFELL